MLADVIKQKRLEELRYDREIKRKEYTIYMANIY